MFSFNSMTCLLLQISSIELIHFHYVANKDKDSTGDKEKNSKEKKTKEDEKSSKVKDTKDSSANDKISSKVQ